MSTVERECLSRLTDTRSRCSLRENNHSEHPMSRKPQTKVSGSIAAVMESRTCDISYQRGTTRRWRRRVLRALLPVVAQRCRSNLVKSIWTWWYLSTVVRNPLAGLYVYAWTATGEPCSFQCNGLLMRKEMLEYTANKRKAIDGELGIRYDKNITYSTNCFPHFGIQPNTSVDALQNVWRSWQADDTGADDSY